MQRYEILNHLIVKYNFTSYLEVGTQHGVCFNEINLPRDRKYCIDISKEFDDLDEEISSDDFFKKLNRTFDLIFIDGDHSYQQSLKDINNALNFVAPNGLIVCHDCYPVCIEETSSRSKGEVYKTILNLRCKNPNVSIYVIDSDCGVGVIRKASQSLINIPSTFEFSWFLENAPSLLNLVSVDQFLNLERP